MTGPLIHRGGRRAPSDTPPERTAATRPRELEWLA